MGKKETQDQYYFASLENQNRRNNKVNMVTLMLVSIVMLGLFSIQLLVGKGNIAISGGTILLIVFVFIYEI